MAKIIVTYHSASSTFVATDFNGNDITYKVNRELNDAIPVSSTTTLGPMMNLLMAMGACSGIDIVMILEKQRQSFDSLVIEINAIREKDVTPALWIKAQIHYFLTGAVDLEKATKAAALSVDKYCSVAETLRRAGCEITHEVSVN